MMQKAKDGKLLPVKEVVNKIINSIKGKEVVLFK
jgi:hypothetical protein